MLAHLQKAMYITGAAIFDAAQRPRSRWHGHDPDVGLGALAAHYVAHVGDSRCYLFRDGKISQITTDHSWVAEQVKAGLLTEQEARESRFRHIITRSVGFEREVQSMARSAQCSPEIA